METSTPDCDVRFDLCGMRVLVTGAAVGLGRRMAEEFLAAGASVALNDIDRETLDQAVKAIGGNVPAIAGNVADEKDVRAVVAQACDRLGGIDVLVNNAGIADQVVSTVRQSTQAWQRVVDVHLRGAYLMSREAGRLMLAAGRGSIVNIASIAGMVGLPGRNAYSAAKAGIIMMTRTLAAEWGRFGVRVNAVAPGYISTPLLEDLIKQGRVLAPVLVRRTPLGRLGRPEEVARCVLFLASNSASFVTGATMAVEGGWTAVGGIYRLNRRVCHDR